MTAIQASRELVSIIMPAYHAGATIAESVRSALTCAYAHLELVIISDDEIDYETVLGRANISDPSIRHLSTGREGAGSAAARNVGLEAANGSLIAMLDADDVFLPGKEQQFDLLGQYGFVSCGLSVRRGGKWLRNVAVGADADLTPAAYKLKNVSMDAMIAYDRRLGDPRVDESMDCLTDLDLVLKLFAHHERCHHLGAAVHAYHKQTQSISIGPEASVRYRKMKQALIEKLRTGAYPMKDEAGPEGFARFLEASLQAENQFETAMAAHPGLIFEDHIMPFLKALNQDKA